MNGLVGHTALRWDWCHVCGRRAHERFAELIYPENAEHPDEEGNVFYVRICASCAGRAYREIKHYDKL